MARVLAARGPVCSEHPHRSAVDHCDACGRRACRECLVRGGPQLLCVTCAEALPRLEAERRRQRLPHVRAATALREQRASIIAGTIIAVTLAALAVPAGAPLMVGDAGGRSAVGTAVARAGEASARMGLGQEAPPGGPPAVPPVAAPGVAATRIPTLLASTGSAVAGGAGTNVAALTDGRLGGAAPAWRSPAGRSGAELRFATGPLMVGRVIFGHSDEAPPETWAKDVEVWLSPNEDEPETIRAGRWTLAQTTAPQSFTFPRTLARSVRLRVLSNHGGADHTSLAEFALLGG